MLMVIIAELGRVSAMLNQYVQKARKPCHGPKSSRVHRYRPPAPGYFCMRAATAAPSGTAKNTAEAIQSVIDDGPACAAIAIQRGPTMQAIAKRVRSRRPSSRLRAGSGIEIEGGAERDLDVRVICAENVGDCANGILLREAHRGGPVLGID